MLAGGIAPGVQDPRHAVRALAPQGDLPVDGVEGDAPPDQAGDAVRPLPGENAHRLRTAQAGAGFQGVPLVQRCRIPGADSRRDAALGVPAVAVVNPALGHHQHAAVLGRQQRGVQPGDPAADDDVVVARSVHLNNRHHSPLAIVSQRKAGPRCGPELRFVHSPAPGERDSDCSRLAQIRDQAGWPHRSPVWHGQRRWCRHKRRTGCHRRRHLPD